MEQNHKNNDCYFFYYSTCTKGDNCAFRHEPKALGCETVCSYWSQGNCLNEQCQFRHMELKKNRKAIPCYWESQRGGCKKPHCPFLHTAERAQANNETSNPTKTNTEASPKSVTQEWSNRPDDGKFDGSGTESDQGRGSSEAESFIGSPAVDPLIVRFDEESDSEGVAPTSPIKRVPYCKTYEEIRLEEIQAESAAYYSYEPQQSEKTSVEVVKDLKIPRSKSLGNQRDKLSSKTDLNFQVLTLDEIKRRKIAQNVHEEMVQPQTDILLSSRKRNFVSDLTSVVETKRQRVVPPVRLRRCTKISQANQVSSATSRETPRRTDIEINLCDSSTCDDTSAMSDGKCHVKNDQVQQEQSISDFPVDELKLAHLIEDQSIDVDYLDTASDDILKDIDAMLTGKSV